MQPLDTRQVWEITEGTHAGSRIMRAKDGSVRVVRRVSAAEAVRLINDGALLPMRSDGPQDPALDLLGAWKSTQRPAPTHLGIVR